MNRDSIHSDKSEKSLNVTPRVRFSWSTIFIGSLIFWLLVALWTLL